MAKTGRPSTFTQKLGDEICKRIALGESLRSVCKGSGMPRLGTVMDWVLDVDKKSFGEQYARARAAQAENMFDELLEIADKADQVIHSGAEKKSSAYAQNQRLKVDTRKWYLSKVLPKKFGDKLDLTSDGKALPQPIYGSQSTDANKNL